MATPVTRASVVNNQSVIELPSVDVVQTPDGTLTNGRPRPPSGFGTTVPASNAGRNIPVTNPNVQASIQAVNGVPTLNVFPDDKPKYYMVMRYSKYSRSSATFVNFEPKGKIILPLPYSGIQDTHEVDWKEEEMGMLMGAAWNGMTNQSAVAARADQIQQQQGSTQNAQSWFDWISQGLNTTGQIAEGIGRAGLQAVVPPTQAIMGMSPNQFLTILLKGPRYKRYEFIWRLVPKSHKESQTIRNIIKELNNSMAPSLELAGTMFGFPHVFWLGYMPNPYFLHKFKPAVLESVTFNYAPSGTPAFYHGPSGAPTMNAPEAVELRCRFIELEYWLHGQFGDSNDPFSDEHRNYTSSTSGWEQQPGERIPGGGSTGIAEDAPYMGDMPGGGSTGGTNGPEVAG